MRKLFEISLTMGIIIRNLFFFSFFSAIKGWTRSLLPVAKDIFSRLGLREAFAKLFLRLTLI